MVKFFYGRCNLNLRQRIQRRGGVLFCQLEHELKAIGEVIEHKIGDQGRIEKSK